MKAVDTNVILRYFLNDEPEQSERARRLIDSGQPIGVTSIVLAEIAWTLAGPHYRRRRAIVAALLIDFLSRENIVALGYDKSQAQLALMACLPETGGASFGDALIAACARSAGVEEIYSFDRGFGRTGLTPVEPA